MALLLGGLILLGIVAELAGSVGLSRVSRIQRRIDAESREALHLPRVSANGRPTLLLVGNSLILEGVDFPRLKTLIAGNYDAHRFIIEQTYYTDWYYALKKLFRHGSQPSRVVLSLSVGQLVADATRGEFTARYAMDVQDLPDLARREHLDMTTASNLLFAHYSGWLGARVEIRKWLLARMVPDAENLANVLGFRQARQVTPETLAMARVKLREIQNLCTINGAEFAVLLPPVITDDGSQLLSRIGAENGVQILVPVQPGEFSRESFRDGFHLNTTGSEAFTPRLAGKLAVQ